jgi:hypothetical protein
MKFILTRSYKSSLKRMGVREEEARAILDAIDADPESGSVVKGLEGLRKLRFAFGGRGKSGGGRAVYFLMVTDDVLAMVFAYAKSDQEDLTSEQRKALRRLMKEIKDG